MNPRRRSLVSLYLLLAAVMAYSVIQLWAPTVRAQDDFAATCCAASSGCSGDLICYSQGDRMPCCLNTELDCKGSGYCEKKHGMLL